MDEVKVLPAGVYACRISACDLHDFKAGGQGFRMRFSPVDPKWKDHRVTAWIPFSHPSEKYNERGLKLLQEIWFACGNEGHWMDAPFAAATLENQVCAIKMAQEDDSRTPGAKQNKPTGAWTTDGKKYQQPKGEPVRKAEAPVAAPKASSQIDLDDDIPF